MKPCWMPTGGLFTFSYCVIRHESENGNAPPVIAHPLPHGGSWLLSSASGGFGGWVTPAAALLKPIFGFNTSGLLDAQAFVPIQITVSINRREINFFKNM